MNEQDRFPIKVWNTLNMSRGCIAIEVTPDHPNNRKWIGIYPLEEGDKRGLYRYLEIELDKEIIEKDLDWFDGDEIKSEIRLDSLDDLYALLTSKNISPKNFDVPWKFSYP